MNINEQILDKVNDCNNILSINFNQNINENILELEKSINKQNANGKLTSIERVKLLSDKNIDEILIKTSNLVQHQCFNFDMQKKKNIGDGALTGQTKVNGRYVFFAAQDFLVSGGSVGYTHGSKIAKTLNLALKQQKPFIFMNDSGGARIQEGVDSLAGYGEIFHANVASSHKIPQISIIMGPCAGGAVYSPALTDFIFMVDKTSYMYLTGPNIIKKVTFEDVTHETLGGASVHSNISGVADGFFQNDIDAINASKILLTYLPDNNKEQPPHNFNYRNNDIFEENSNIEYLVPSSLNDSYDMLTIINEIIDKDSLFEIKKYFAQNIITAFARIGGIVCGIIANQPAVLAGCIDSKASLKAEKFIRFCNAFNIPIVSIVDVPGFLPGTDQEYSGVISHGSKLLYAYSNATVPKITLIIRKAYGGAYIVMNSKHLGADLNFSWPNSQIGVMGIEGAAELLLKTNDKNKQEAFNFEYNSILNPEYAARCGFIDDIIEPKMTRQVLFKSLLSLIKKPILETN